MWPQSLFWPFKSEEIGRSLSVAKEKLYSLKRSLSKDALSKENREGVDKLVTEMRGK